MRSKPQLATTARLARFALLVALPLAGIVARGGPAASAEAGAGAAGEWSPVMSWPGVAVHAALLPTGEVLTWDAWEKPTPTHAWDPRTGAFRSNESPSGLFCSGHTFLADGRLLVAGGHDVGSAFAGIRDTNAYSPGTTSWARAQPMAERRWYPSLTRMGDGRVLALSGNTTWTEWADTPELFDPATGRWSPVGVNTSEVHEEEYPLTFLLPDGRLFTLAPAAGTSHILDVDGPSWADAGLGATPILSPSAAMFRPGQVLISGGGPVHQGAPSVRDAAQVDLNAESPEWRGAGAMHYPRYMHSLVVLPDGTVLAVGGSAIADQEAYPDQATLPAEIWDPRTGRWTELAGMATPRMYHSTALLLPDGRVLVAGGGRYNGTSDFADTEIFSPPYLFAGPRPAITSAPGGAGHGQTVSVGTDRAGDIASVALVNLGSVTHGIDMDQRYVPVSFERRSSGRLDVTLPANPSVAPPGYYMLFIVDAAGVPSEAKIIHVGGTGSPPPEPEPSPRPQSRRYGITIAGIASEGSFQLSASAPLLPEARAQAAESPLFDATSPVAQRFLCQLPGRRRGGAPPP